MNKYPNLKELMEYYPCGEPAICDHAQIEPELLAAVLNGKELLTPIEIMGLARLYECPMGVLNCPKVIMLDMNKSKHRRMVTEVDLIYIQLKHMAEDGNPKAAKYLEWAGQNRQRFMRAVCENKLSYGHYLGIKEKLGQYVSFSTPRPKRRGLASV